MPTWTWAILIVLLALRLPSLVQPAGGDQGLYGYAGQRILSGDVMYRDAWDQKPPAIAFLYALLWKVWPQEAVVPAADIAAAALVAGLLILLGHRLFSSHVGCGAAAIFLLAGDPYLQRMSGIFVRAQCEPFIALAITSSLVLVAYGRGRRLHLIAAGAALAAAVWLKYNAVTYALPIAVATWAWSPHTDRELARRSFSVGGRSPLFAHFAFIGLGFAFVSSLFLVYLAAHGALHDWRLATIDYNIRYSNETYDTPASILRYLVIFPIARARLDMLWFLGGLGALLLAPGVRSQRSTLVIFTWILAAALSIAINGSRGLPNYFVQANPALALAASAGLATLAHRGARVRFVAGALLLALHQWRVPEDRREVRRLRQEWRALPRLRRVQGVATGVIGLY